MIRKLKFVTHKYIHIYGFYDIVNLLGSSPGTAPHLLNFLQNGQETMK